MRKKVRLLGFGKTGNLGQIRIIPKIGDTCKFINRNRNLRRKGNIKNKYG